MPFSPRGKAPLAVGPVEVWGRGRTGGPCDLFALDRAAGWTGGPAARAYAGSRAIDDDLFLEAARRREVEMYVERGGGQARGRACHSSPSPTSVFPRADRSAPCRVLYPLWPLRPTLQWAGPWIGLRPNARQGVWAAGFLRVIPPSGLGQARGPIDGPPILGGKRKIPTPAQPQPSPSRRPPGPWMAPPVCPRHSGGGQRDGGRRAGGVDGPARSEHMTLWGQRRPIKAQSYMHACIHIHTPPSIHPSIDSR